jgi:S-adenosyl methyltransferase
MSHATPLELAAQQLHAAAADVISIAKRREHDSDQAQPGCSFAGPPSASQAGPEGDGSWMSALNTADEPGCGFDPTIPHSARIYSYWLGGKDHFPADRRAAEEVVRKRPQVVAGARANRAFLARAVRYLAAERGIRQFVDIGTGLPAPSATHQVAQSITPQSRVVYVDNDPLVLVHARALLTPAPQGTCDFVDADLRDPAGILTKAAGTLDFTQPIGVLLLAILHFLPDTCDPPAIIAALAAGLAPGSCLVLSHLTADLAPEQVTAATAAYNTTTPVPVTARTHAQITGLFGGLPLLPPGVVPVTEWRPRPGEGLGPPVDLFAGIARIPARGHR